MISIYKPIKFFLNVGENKIRSLDDLRKGSDFHLDYLYGLFKDGILERWLQIHKYTDEYNALKDLPKDELNEETAFKFCSILLPGLEDTSLQLYSNNLLFEKKWSEYLTTIKDTKNQYDKIINDYHSGFERLKTFIKRDALNMPRIKTHLEELSLKYLKLYKINPNSFLEFVKEKSPITLLLMMSNSILRREIEASPDYDNILKFLHNNIPINPNAKPAPKPFKQDFSKNYNASNLGDAPLKAALSGFNLVFSDSAPATENDTAGNFKYYDFVFPKKGNTRKDVTTLIRTYRTKRTDGAWDYPEGDSQKKFMILYCPPKANVRKDKATNSDLSPKELEKFPIITSLEYKSLSIDDYLIYMEV